MKKIIPLITILIIFVACGTSKKVAEVDNEQAIDTNKRVSFNKVMKSKNYNLKYYKAKKYYERKKYTKTQDLCEQLIPYYRGQERGREAYFLYAMCNYNMKLFLLAGEYFRKFYNTYPGSPEAEQALYLSAYCFYRNSPRWSLDQAPTKDAISQFQLFIAKYPNSNKIDSCNLLIDTLRYTLEKKSFNAAKLYYKIGYYKAGEIALRNSLKEFPDSYYAEDIYYYIAKSSVKFAQGSIISKQAERYKNAIKNCSKYLKKYPNGKYYSEIEKSKHLSDKNLLKLKKQT